jgi:hypothetical protein
MSPVYEFMAVARVQKKGRFCSWYFRIATARNMTILFPKFRNLLPYLTELSLRLHLGPDTSTSSVKQLALYIINMKLLV